jgi:hypothetical protein
MSNEPKPLARIPYGEISKDARSELYERLVSVAVEWAKEYHVGGLSHMGLWNLYVGLEEAVFDAEAQEKALRES